MGGDYLHRRAKFLNGSKEEEQRRKPETKYAMGGGGEKEELRWRAPLQPSMESVRIKRKKECGGRNEFGIGGWKESGIGFVTARRVYL